MLNPICLDENHSTTRLLTQEQPEIVKNPKDKFESVLFLPVGENRKGEGGLRAKGYFKQSYDDKPLISIITVVFNGEKYLEETILSIINQTYDNVEYIIIDGGSIDGTLDIIKKYEDKIDYWVSERDKGIYDAMNKGIDLAHGDWINFMNAADRFINLSVIKELKCDDFVMSHNLGIITGFVKIVDLHGNWLGYRHPYQNLENCCFVKDNCIAHQATFTSRNTLKTVGHFSTEYKIQGDYDYWLKAKKLNIKILQLKKDVALFSNDGLSSNRSFLYLSMKEKYRSLYRNNYIGLLKYFYLLNRDLLAIRCKMVMKRILGKRLSEKISNYNFKKRQVSI
jgi:glycosyltransferase involved in cell wall biosynthesis